MNIFFKIKTKIKDIFSFFKIDYSFLLVLIFSIFASEIKLYLIYILFLLLHELSHFFVAKKLGYLPKRLHLNFFGAALEGYDDFLCVDEIKIILAGPLFNFFVMIVCCICFWFFPDSYEYLYLVLNVNQVIFIFNMLPIFPLDCGRLILCFLSLKFSRLDSLKFIRNFSITFLIVSYIFLIFSFDLSLSVSILNLIFLVFSSAKGTSFKREFFVKKKLKHLSKGLPLKVIVINNDVPLYMLFKFIDFNYVYKFVFFDDDYNFLNEMTEFEMYSKLGFDCK